MTGLPLPNAYLREHLLSQTSSFQAKEPGLSSEPCLDSGNKLQKGPRSLRKRKVERMHLGEERDRQKYARGGTLGKGTGACLQSSMIWGEKERMSMLGPAS